MGMTMTQKILARAAGLPQAEAGQLIEGRLDLVLGNDITTPVAITEFKKAGLSAVFDREKIAAAGHPDVVVILVTNSDDYENLTIQTGACNVLDKVIQV